MEKLRALFFLFAVAASAAFPAGNVGARWLFPESKQYVYRLKSNISTGTLLPVHGGSHWTLDAQLAVLVFNETRLRFRLENVKTTLFNKNGGLQHNSQAHSLPPDASVLQQPWEANYFLETGALYAVNLANDDPLWSANIKRALAISLQLQRVNSTDPFSKKSYSVMEPCLHDTCQADYSGVATDVIRKFHTVPTTTRGIGRYMWLSVLPDICTKDLKQPFVGNAERVYRLDDTGLVDMELRSSLQYHSHNHVLTVTTHVHLQRERVTLLEMDNGPWLNVTYPAYYTHTYKEPSNGRRVAKQADLVQRTRELLTKVSENIDHDSVVRDADKIHSMDLIELHRVMSQLNADSLKFLNNELHVGTSYLNETNKNLFFEVLPHVRSSDSALLVRFLVMEFNNQKFEDATALSLLRRMPFNVAEYSQDLLMQMEGLLNLGPEVPQQIRHASILSFATLAFHTYLNGACKQDEFEGYVQKYFRMYKEYPSYVDRLVWLQGLANLQLGSVSSYLSQVVQDPNASRHERFLAVWATMPLAGFNPDLITSLYWPILTNPKEDLQLRVSAMVMLLFGEQSANRVLSIHHYISSCEDNHLKRFWYTTVKSFEKSTFSCYHPLAKLTSYVSKLVIAPDQRFWGTGNYIVDTSDDDRDSAAMMQVWTIAEPLTGLPAVVYLTINTNQAGLLTNQIAMMVKAEGVTANFLNKLVALNSEAVHLDQLADLLKRMKVEARTLEKVHIEVLLKVQGQTVYASHLNQTTFDLWTGADMMNTIQEFLMSQSHVNQQLVQFPLQADINLPTELGTPVTLQSIVSSFFSMRGTLTSQSAADTLTRKNDIHLRYHGTAVTTLSSAGPLLGSEHSARIQQSMDAHLPLKFDVAISLAKKAFHIIWLNEDQTGGIALHARSEVSLDMGYGRELWQFCPSCERSYTVRTKDVRRQNDASGYYFDCDRPMTGVELVEKLLDSNRANYDFFSSLRPSLIVVHGLFLLSVPPSGACGVILPSRYPFHLPPGNTLELKLQLAQLDVASEESITLKIKHELTLKDTKSFGEVFLNINGSTVLENTNQKLRVGVKLAGYQPTATDPNRRHWKLCIEEQDIYRVPGDQDIQLYPGPFQGELKIAYDSSPYQVPGSCPNSSGSQLYIKYSGEPKIEYATKEITRYFDLKLYGQNLPKLTVLSELGIGQVAAVGQILQKLTADPLNVTANIVEKNGLADITLDNGPKWQFHTDNFNWLLDNWSNTQLLKKFGIYRECRLQVNTVSTLAGTVEQLESHACSESLALADCTEKPRFALLRLRDGGYKLYTGGDYVTIQPLGIGAPRVSVNGHLVDYSRGYRHPQDEKFYDFKISAAADSVRVTSRLSGVQLFYKPSEAIILVPDTYMSVACGSCVSKQTYHLCP